MNVKKQPHISIVVGRTSLLTALVSLLVVCGAGLVFWWIYTGLQGCRDDELVRFARMVSVNDGRVVAVAKSLSRDKEAAWAEPALAETVALQFEPEDLDDAIAVLWFVVDIKGSDPKLPFVAYFDWKQGGTEVTDALDAMLGHVGLRGPTKPEIEGILREAEEGYQEFGAIPIITARYDRFFRSQGYMLAHINTSSDSYFLTVLPPKTARCWNGVSLRKDPTMPDGYGVFIEPAIVQSADFIRQRATEMVPLLEVPVQDAPSSACLPFWTVWSGLLR